LASAQCSVLRALLPLRFGAIEDLSYADNHH
jgi:hypothetical protein